MYLPYRAFLLAKELYLLIDRGDDAICLGLDYRDRTILVLPKKNGEVQYGILGPIYALGKTVNPQLYSVIDHGGNNFSVFCDGNKIV